MTYKMDPKKWVRVERLYIPDAAQSYILNLPGKCCPNCGAEDLREIHRSHWQDWILTTECTCGYQCMTCKASFVEPFDFKVTRRTFAPPLIAEHAKELASHVHAEILYDWYSLAQFESRERDDHRDWQIEMNRGCLKNLIARLLTTEQLTAFDMICDTARECKTAPDDWHLLEPVALMLLNQQVPLPNLPELRGGSYP